jgi:predicted  nucleic acid-binding Zn-ribbon protein
MVDSPQEETMTNGADNLRERVQAIEQKLDALASSVDRRFDQVDAAMVEQRAYSQFAYETLDSRMSTGFATLDRKTEVGFARVDGRIARLERKIDQIIDLQIAKPPTDGSTEE